jgi:ribosomal protein S27AE
MMDPRNAVQMAVRKRILTREPCSRCGAPKTHAHHEDYRKPLDVIWLCAPCHKQRHKELKQYAQGYVPLSSYPISTKEITYVRLDPAVKQALSRVAQIDGRSLSALISKIATDWVKQFAADKPTKESRR